MNAIHTKKQIKEAIAYWEKKLAESHFPIDSETSEYNARDILKDNFKEAGPGYSADAFVAFFKEMASQDLSLAQQLRRFLGKFASGSLSSKYVQYGDSAGLNELIAKSLVSMLGAAIDELKKTNNIEE